MTSPDGISSPAMMIQQHKVFRPWVLARLALVNSIGYSGSVIVPLWVGGIGTFFAMPDWFGGAVATAQLLAAALFNLLTPLLFRDIDPARLARWALPFAGAFYLLTLFGYPLLFVLASLAGGSCLGVVLNATNRLIAGSEEVQKGYSIFLISEGLFSFTMFFCGTLLGERFGLIAIFLTLPVVTILGALVMASLPHFPAVERRMILKSPMPAGSNGVRPLLGLLAILTFFCGQNCITASTLALGQAAGVTPKTASMTLAFAVIFGLCGAISSRLLGERLGVRRPILVATATLAAVSLVVTLLPSRASFTVGIFCVQLTTLFIVPYFFTLLAKLDASGRAASVGPAFLLIGIAAGPSLAAWIVGTWDVPALGSATVVAMTCSALLTVATALRGRLQPVFSGRVGS